MAMGASLVFNGGHHGWCVGHREWVTGKLRPASNQAKRLTLAAEDLERYKNTNNAEKKHHRKDGKACFIANTQLLKVVE